MKVNIPIEKLWGVQTGTAYQEHDKSKLSNKATYL